MKTIPVVNGDLTCEIPLLQLEHCGNSPEIFPDVASLQSCPAQHLTTQLVVELTEVSKTSELQ